MRILPVRSSGSPALARSLKTSWATGAHCREERSCAGCVSGGGSLAERCPLDLGSRLGGLAAAGQTMVEYAVLLSLIALALVGPVFGLGQQVGNRFQSITNTLANGGSNSGLPGGGGDGGGITPPPTTITPPPTTSPTTNPKPETGEKPDPSPDTGAPDTTEKLTGRATLTVSGTTATAHVEATNAGSLAYRWFNDDGEIQGESGQSISLTDKGKDYWCVVTADGFDGSLVTEQMAHGTQKTTIVQKRCGEEIVGHLESVDDRDTNSYTGHYVGYCPTHGTVYNGFSTGNRYPSKTETWTCKVTVEEVVPTGEVTWSAVANTHK